MNGAADPGADAQSPSYLNPQGSESDLFLTGSHFDLSAAEETAKTPSRRSSSGRELVFFDAFEPKDSTLQYNYPSPDVAPNYQTHPYPAQSAKSPAETAACDSPYQPDQLNNTAVDIARRQAHRLGLGHGSIIAADQTTAKSERNSCPSIGHGRDDSDLGTSIGPSTPLFAVGKEPYIVVQEIPGLDRRLTGARGHPLGSANLFPDDTKPYVPGNKQIRPEQVYRMAEVANHGQVTGSDFVCGTCETRCSSKSGLSHHLIIHDKSKKHRHVCAECAKGFRYPKDLKRHVHDVHDKDGEVKFRCPECHGTYNPKRKDRRTRHLKSKRHIASQNDVASSTSTSFSQHRPHYDVSPRSDPRAPIQSNISSNGSIQSSTRRARINSETSGQLDHTSLIPPQDFRRLSSLLTSFTTISAEDTPTTTSDVDSFCSL